MMQRLRKIQKKIYPVEYRYKQLVRTCFIVRIVDMSINSEDEYKVVYTSPDEKQPVEEEPIRDERWKHTVASKTAYFLGIGEERFSENEVFDREVFDELRKSKHARIIRNLCILRTAILRNSAQIHNAIIYDMKNLSSLPEYIPQKSLTELAEDGIDIQKANYKLNNYTIDINGHIKNRINNCKQFYPEWVNWDYVKEIFIMPDGTKESGVIAESRRYNANKNTFPFRMYINWAYDDCGNILYHDGRFMQALYEMHEDRFEDMSKVRDASEATKTSIYDYLDKSRKASIIVDCENSDVYKLYAVLKNLDQKALLSKITSIILFDDFHTTRAWELLKEFVTIPVIYKQIDRVKENKSLVDQTLMITATKMVYTEEVDSFILAASDSDYWALMKELPDTRFLVMAEYEKCGPDIKMAMEQKGIHYCYMDDFCTDNIADIKNRIFMKELRKDIETSVRIDLNEIISEAIERTRMALTPDEKEAFIKKIQKNLHIIVDNGTIILSID